MLAFIGYIQVDLGNTWPGAPKVCRRRGLRTITP
jgi:hypothetical protein